MGMKELMGGCPREYVDILGYIDRLRYYDAPNYETVYDLLRRALRSMDISEHPYDWE